MRADADAARAPAASASPVSGPAHAALWSRCHRDKHRDQDSVNSTSGRDQRRIVTPVFVELAPDRSRERRGIADAECRVDLKGGR